MRLNTFCFWLGLASLGFLSGPAATARDPWEEMFEQPLVKWALEIGDAKSLPWGDPHSWNGLAAGYDIQMVPGDTLALLVPDAPVLARMESLRRAVAYSQKDPRIALQVLAALVGRVREADAAGKPNVSAWFDLGYMYEASKQAEWLKNQPMDDLNGYSLVVKAAEVAGGNASGALEMQFACGLILLEPKGQHPYYPHFRTAVLGAREGTLLGENLLLHLRDKFEASTLAEMRKSRYLLTNRDRQEKRVPN